MGKLKIASIWLRIFFNKPSSNIYQYHHSYVNVRTSLSFLFFMISRSLVLFGPYKPLTKSLLPIKQCITCKLITNTKILNMVFSTSNNYGNFRFAITDFFFRIMFSCLDSTISNQFEICIF